MSLALSAAPARIATAYVDLCKNAVQGVAKVCKAAEKIAHSPRLRAGHAAVVTLPLSIMLRQGAQGGYAMLEGKAKPVRPLIAGIGAIAGAWLAGQGFFAATAASLHGLTALAYISAVAGGVMVMPAAAAIALVGVAAAVGAGGAVLATVPAVMNIHIGLIRSMDAARGNNYIYDLPPPSETPGPAAVVATPVGETFNAEAAVTLGGDISFKKVRLNFANKPPAPSLQK